VRKLIIVTGTMLIVGFFFVDAFGWGSNTHRFINRVSVYHLPGNMQLFIQDSSYFATHAPDADSRKVSSDTSMFAESPKHYLDIDEYPNFHNLPRDFDTLIALYGWQRVKDNGTLPWATLWCLDSLTHQLTRGAWAQAYLTASDLGHYVGDAHQPLHATNNYDGGLTGNNGIHSRYESTMLSSTYFLSQLRITPESVVYVPNKRDFIFEYIYHSNGLVDSIMHSDTYAKTQSGGQYNATYYNTLWARTGGLTLDQMQLGTKALASFWYTAWVDAGLITTGVEPVAPTVASDFRLDQNYPNPFNPSTTISYALPVAGTVFLNVYSLDGRQVASVVHETQSAGRHTVRFDASHLASGTYFYRLHMGSFSQTRKFLVVK
jgi:hypothetical protein